MCVYIVVIDYTCGMDYRDIQVCPLALICIIIFYIVFFIYFCLFLLFSFYSVIIFIVAISDGLLHINLRSCVVVSYDLLFLLLCRYYFAVADPNIKKQEIVNSWIPLLHIQTLCFVLCALIIVLTTLCVVKQFVSGFVVQQCVRVINY